MLYYAQAVDKTLLMVLSTIAVEQSKATEFTMDLFEQLLHTQRKIEFKKSDMILNICSDVSSLGAPKAKSQAAGLFFLG